MFIGNRCLCCCQSCNRYAERRAGDIVQTYLVAELDGSGIAAVLTADTKVDVRANLAALLCCHSDQLADTVLVKVCEGIGLIDLACIVILQELAGIVTGEAEGHLGQIVGYRS